MKISKSKQGLARIISENGGWREGSEFAAQDSNKNTYGARVCFYHSKPCVNGSKWIDGSNGLACNAGECIDGLMAINNWHQTILSREEYFHLHPAPDADGWIEWKGGECPVSDDSIIDVKFKSGHVGVGLSPLPGGGAGRESWMVINGSHDVIAYRPHKPNAVKPTDFGAIGDDETNLAAKEGRESMEYQPTIEQLAADYRNAKDYADRKQQEADDAKADADEKLMVLELAGEALGLSVSPITEKQEPELVITDWRDLRVGDVIEVTGSSNEGWQKVKGKELTIKIVRSDGASTGEWLVRGNTEFRLVRRP